MSKEKQNAYKQFGKQLFNVKKNSSKINDTANKKKKIIEELLGN